MRHHAVHGEGSFAGTGGCRGLFVLIHPTRMPRPIREKEGLESTLARFSVLFPSREQASLLCRCCVVAAWCLCVCCVFVCVRCCLRVLCVVCVCTYRARLLRVVCLLGGWCVWFVLPVGVVWPPQTCVFEGAVCCCVAAVSYSPTPSQVQYHRRCGA